MVVASWDYDFVMPCSQTDETAIQCCRRKFAIITLPLFIMVLFQHTFVMTSVYCLLTSLHTSTCSEHNSDSVVHTSVHVALQGGVMHLHVHLFADVVRKIAAALFSCIRFSQFIV